MALASTFRFRLHVLSRINFFNTGTEQVFPRQGLESLYPNFSAGPGFNTFLRPDVSSSNLISLRPTTNMATGISPLLKDDEETGLFAEGLTTGGASSPLRGGFSVMEVFGEYLMEVSDDLTI